MICASVCLLLLISPSPESEDHTQFRADLGEQVTITSAEIRRDVVNTAQISYPWTIILSNLNPTFG
jgi:hypothetical protein